MVRPVPLTYYSRKDLAKRARVVTAGALVAASLGAAPSLAPAITQVNLDSLNGTNGMSISGAAPDDFLGFSLSGIGDFDGDGYDDFVIGADGFDPAPGRTDAGAAFVIYGVPSGFPANLSLASLTADQGFKIIGDDTQDYAGVSVNGAGDFNGDGFHDVIVGAHQAESGFPNQGAAYIIFGSATRPGLTVDTSSMPASRGITIQGQAAGDRMGSYVSGAGDFNGDGFDDVLIGANLADVGARVNAGKAYLVFGKASPTSFFVNDMAAGSGLVLTGKVANGEAGWTASGLGDINGDGLDDIAVSAHLVTADGLQRAGEVYVIFGSRTNPTLTLPLENLNGTNGFTLKGDEAGGMFGFMVTAGGDINGDGFNDILISKSFERDAYGYSPVAKKYVVYGRATAFPASSSISALTTAQRTILDGTRSDRRSGQILAGAGDTNGDGFFDILIGEPLEPSGGPTTVAGEAYLVRGKASLGGSINVPSLSNADGTVYKGIESEDFAGGAVSAAGDVNSDGAGDFLIGALLADPISFDDDAGEAYLVLGTPNNSLVTYRTYVASSNPPRKAVGVLGDGSQVRPASRFYIDYADGTGSGSGSSSLETVQLIHTISSINGGNFAPPTVWRLASTRTAFTNFSVTINYKDSEVAQFNEDELVVFRADLPQGPWEKLTPTLIDKKRNLIRVTTPKAGYFAVADSEAGNADIDIPLVKSWDFNPNDSWIFLSAPPLTVPGNSAQNGTLSLTVSSNSTITYGYWVTELANTLKIDPFDPMTDPNQTGELAERMMPLYLVRYYLKSSVADTNEVPLMRLRVNSSSFEDYHSLDINNLPNNPWVPSSTGFSAHDLLFHPHPYMSLQPVNDRYYYISFDIISFPPTGGNDANTGTYQLDKVEVYKIPLEALEKVADAKTYNFSTTQQLNEWQGYPSQYTSPTFGKTIGRLEMSSPATNEVYGNMQNLPFTVSVNQTGQTGQLYVQTRWRVGADEPNPFKVPQMRFRVMPQDFGAVSVTGALDWGTATFGPRQGSDRYYLTYLPVPATPAPYPLHVAWDVLVFETFFDENHEQQAATTPELVYLKNLDIDLIRIRNYPPAN